MKKIIINISSILILIFIISQMILKSSVLVYSVKSSLSLWLNNLVPTLFPFFLFSSILINYSFVEMISELLKPFMNKIFRLNSNTSFILIMSMISGIPSNAKYIELLLNKELINSEDANKIIKFSHFSNPIFIIQTIGISLLHNYKIGIIILISHYLGNFIIGLFLRNKIKVKEEINISNIKNKLNTNNNLGLIISNSIKDSINTILLILGVITLFMIFASYLNIYLNTSFIYKAIINGIFEITQGIKLISLTNISTKYKGLIITCLLSFGGLSSHIQVMSILAEKKIRYKSYLLSRIVHVIISSILYLLFSYFYRF